MKLKCSEPGCTAMLDVDDNIARLVRIKCANGHENLIGPTPLSKMMQRIKDDF